MTRVRRAGTRVPAQAQREQDVRPSAAWGRCVGAAGVVAVGRGAVSDHAHRTQAFVDQECRPLVRERRP